MNSKECTNCHGEKELSAFHFKKSENRYHSWCKDCVHTLQRSRWKDRKRKAVEILGGSCSECGYHKSLAALCFHHTDPSKKEFTWIKMRLLTWSKVVEELKKCVLLCSNCHAELHSPDENYSFSGRGTDNSLLNRQDMVSTGRCPICDVEVYGTKYCSVRCSTYSLRRVKNRPSKDEIMKKLETMTMVDISKEYGVSDAAVRKWLK
jgi:hypothetical protein